MIRHTCNRYAMDAQKQDAKRRPMIAVPCAPCKRGSHDTKTSNMQSALQVRKYETEKLELVKPQTEATKTPHLPPKSTSFPPQPHSPLPHPSPIYSSANTHTPPLTASAYLSPTLSLSNLRFPSLIPSSSCVLGISTFQNPTGLTARA